MSVDTRHHDATRLLEAEHAVARVLAEACDEAEAYPRLLAAVGDALGWEAGSLWTDAREPPRDGLPRRVLASGAPAWVREESTSGVRTAICFPIRGADDVLGAIEFFAAEGREPDASMLETMASLGTRIGHSVERWRGEERLRESDARKTAILDGAFDAIVLMDASGDVVEVNAATERMFGYTAAEMVGRELAELIVPPRLREAHRHGVAQYVDTGVAILLGHPVELPAMRADGSEFPVEIAITRPALPGPPQFTGFIRDVTQRQRDELALRALAEEQAALRRVATTVALEADQERLFRDVTEEVGRLLGANSANTLRFEPDGTGVVVGAWSTGGVQAVPLGTRETLDGATAGAQILRSGRPARVDSFEGVEGSTAELLRSLGFCSAVGAPINLGGRLWGAVLISSVEECAFPEGAERRVGDFAELVGMALANAEAREELAASRARIVEAGDAERRRIERNLHDGAQQRLVALSLVLRLAGKKLAAGGAADELLEQASAELGDALTELRELARGIHPAILTDRGLRPALEMLAGRASIPVELSIELDGRLPRAVEAAAYYITAEAVTNASKYARAARVRVRVDFTDGAVTVDVADDGVGGADPVNGSGLRGLADRVEALGGTLEVRSPPGAGTALTARMPCR
jgi:PAS domain S-box-containing protein